MMVWIETIKMLIRVNMVILYLLVVVQIVMYDRRFLRLLCIEVIIEKLVIFSCLESSLNIDIFAKYQRLRFDICWLVAFEHLRWVDKFTSLCFQLFID